MSHKKPESHGSYFDPHASRMSGGIKIEGNDKAETFSIEAARLAERVGPLLHGNPPAVVGGALADLLATWLAGHRGQDKAATEQARAALLAIHVSTVLQLIPVNEAIMDHRLAGDAP